MSIKWHHRQKNSGAHQNWLIPFQRCFIRKMCWAPWVSVFNISLGSLNFFMPWIYSFENVRNAGCGICQSDFKGFWAISMCMLAVAVLLSVLSFQLDQSFFPIPPCPKITSSGAYSLKGIFMAVCLLERTSFWLPNSNHSTTFKLHWKASSYNWHALKADSMRNIIITTKSIEISDFAWTELGSYEPFISKTGQII